jgi:hypothetical protein
MLERELRRRTGGGGGFTGFGAMDATGGKSNPDERGILGGRKR